jgi:hypothetical protein
MKCYSILGRSKKCLFPFSFFQAAKTGFGNHPLSKPMGTGVVSLKIKRPGHEANHSVQHTAEIMNGWSHIYVPIVSLNEANTHGKKK